MKTINVVAMLLKKNDKYLMAKRKKGFLKGRWEFPGGKIEKNETKYEAIEREIKEELDISIRAIEVIGTTSNTYDDVMININYIKCEFIKGKPKIIVHDEIKYFQLDDINKNDKMIFCDSDFEMINKLKILNL